ncbi:MAG TPA: DUF2231 domain-containing protein [Blastocatellia bacterium]|nr:DUF2231 domain-containing protein [Blastocatellia bacterium]
MTSPASIKGHPIHPMLIVFPIALWVFSLISDLIYLARPELRVWSDVAYYTMAGGLIGALLAAIPGLIDLMWIRDRVVKRVGVTHMIINLIVVALFAINLWLRSTSARNVTGLVILSAIGIVLMCLSGWLGGKMVYVHGVGVEPLAPEERRDMPRRAA